MSAAVGSRPCLVCLNHGGVVGWLVEEGFCCMGGVFWRGIEASFRYWYLRNMLLWCGEREKCVFILRGGVCMHDVVVGGGVWSVLG